jgi:hypothetical protein
MTCGRILWGERIAVSAHRFDNAASGDNRFTGGLFWRGTMGGASWQGENARDESIVLFAPFHDDTISKRLCHQSTSSL